MRTLAVMASLLVLCLCAASTTVALEQGVKSEGSEDAKLNRAVDLIEQGKLDEAERLLEKVDKADENHFQRRLGAPERHWIARDYLQVIKRRRAGDRSDQLFRSKRFRFNARDIQLSEQEMNRLQSDFENMLTRVAQWADEKDWQKPYHKAIFVEIAESFRISRTLIFFWDRQDRSPRMEITSRHAHSNVPEQILAQEQILAHEMTHVILPHTNRPLAEGMANLAMKELFPDRDSPFKRHQQLGLPEPWPLEEVLLFNVRTQGKIVQQMYESIISHGAVRGTGKRLMMAAYTFGEQLIDMIQKKWGRATLMDYYRSTNRDPASFDMLKVTAEKLAPLEELQVAWTNQLKQAEVSRPKVGPRQPEGDVKAFWNRFDWYELYQSEQQLWSVLGWNEASWHREADPPVSNVKSWSELTDAERAAAERLGYTQAIWD